MKDNTFNQAMRQVSEGLQQLIELEQGAARHEVEPKEEKQIRSCDMELRAYDPEEAEEEFRRLSPTDKLRILKETMDSALKAQQAMNIFAENTIRAVNTLAGALLQMEGSGALDPAVYTAVGKLATVDLWEPL